MLSVPVRADAADTWSAATIFESNGWLGGSGNGPIALGRFDQRFPQVNVNQIAIVGAPGGLAALFEATSTFQAFMFNDPLFNLPSGGQTQYAINCIAVGKVDGRRSSTDVVLFADDWSAYEAYWDSGQNKWVTELIFTDWDAWYAFDTPAFRQIAIGEFDSSHSGLEAVTAGGNSGHVTELYYSSGWQSRRLADFTDQMGDAVNVQSVAVGDFDPTNSGNEIVASRAYPYQAVEVYGSGSTWNTRTVVNMVDLFPWGGEHFYAASVADIDPTHSGNEVYMGTYQAVVQAWWNGNGFFSQIIPGSSVFPEAVIGLAAADFDPGYAGTELVAGGSHNGNDLIYEFRYSGGWQNSFIANVPYLRKGSIIVESLDPSIPGVQIIVACAHSVRVIALSGLSMVRFKVVYEILAARDALKSVMKKGIDDYASLIVELNSIGSPIFASGSAAGSWPDDLNEDIAGTLIDTVLNDAQLKKDLQALGDATSNKQVAAQFIDRAAQESEQIAKLKKDAKLNDLSSILSLIASIETKVLGDSMYATFDNSLASMLQHNQKLSILFNSARGVTSKATVVDKINQAFSVSTLYSDLDSDAQAAVNYVNSLATLPTNVDLLVGSLQDFTSQLVDVSQGRRSVVVAPRVATQGSGRVSVLDLPNLYNYWKQVQYYAGQWKAGQTLKASISYAGRASGWVSTASSAVLLFVPASAPVTLPLAVAAGLFSTACTLAETAVDSYATYTDAQMYILFESSSHQLANRYMGLVPNLLDSRFLSYVEYYLTHENPDSSASIQSISWSRHYDGQVVLGATKVDISVTTQNVQAQGALLLYSLWPAGTSEPVDLKMEVVGSGTKPFRAPISFSWVKGSYDGRFELWVGARRASWHVEHFDTGIFSSSTSLGSGSLAAGGSQSASLNAAGSSSATVQLLYKGSQMDVHVYDAQNHHLGVNYATGAVENNIPGATYGGSESSPDWASLPAGTYSLSVVGVSTTSGGLGAVDASEAFALHGSTNAASPGVLAVNPTQVEFVMDRPSSLWFDVQIQESTGQNGLLSFYSDVTDMTGPSGFIVSAGLLQIGNALEAGGQSYVRVHVNFPYNAPVGQYTGTLHVHAIGQGGSNPSYDAAIPISVTVNQMGTRAGVSQPYIVGFKVSNVYSDSHTGDFFYATTGWSQSPASFQVTLAAGESLFLIGTAQIWNDYASIGSSIAICKDGARISGDMFAAGATIASREIASAVAVDSPDAGTYTYSLSAKTDPGGKAWVSQPYLLAFKVPSAFASSHTGDYYTSSTGWWSTGTEFSVSLGAGESLFLIGTAQVWNDYASIGSSIAICKDGARISGDMFAAGATITNRELATAVAIDTPGEGSFTYSLSAKTDPGGRAGVSQPYLLAFKVSGVYSNLAEGDHYVTATSWSSSGASLQASLGAGESLFLIGTGQLWNEYSTIGSSIAVCSDDGLASTRVSGDMFAAGATITRRELAVAIAISTPGAGTWTYSLSAKTD
jgi:hypothetical protein